MTKKIFRWAPAILAVALIASPRSYAHDNDTQNHDGQIGNHDGDESNGHRKSVPEPATLMLIAMGLGGVAAIRRQRKVS
jgi:hypothetical protein